MEGIMNKNSILVGIIGLLVGVIITGVVAGQAVNNNNTAMMRMMGVKSTQSTSHSSMSMDDMTEQLKDKSGDEFDKAFVAMMIAHHEGAVDMAELIPSRAKHDEVKKLGAAIIAAQTKEIADMKSWQQSWGYSSSMMMNGMNHDH
jgi:uncharacterized protein (DUF305 family)